MKKYKGEADKNKRNTQFLFFCNLQKSGTSRVCITFPQMAQKLLKIHLCKQINEVLSFLKVFSVRKTIAQLF